MDTLSPSNYAARQTVNSDALYNRGSNGKSGIVEMVTVNCT